MSLLLAGAGCVSLRTTFIYHFYYQVTPTGILYQTLVWAIPMWNPSQQAV